MHHLNLAGGTKRAHHMENRTKRKKGKATSKYVLRTVRPFSYHGSMFPWKPNLKPVAATGVAQRNYSFFQLTKLLSILKASPPTALQNITPACHPWYKTQTHSGEGRESKENATPCKAGASLYAANNAETTLASTRLKVLCAILHVTVCKTLPSILCHWLLMGQTKFFGTGWLSFEISPLSHADDFALVCLPTSQEKLGDGKENFPGDHFSWH